MSEQKKPVVKLVDTSGTIRLDLNDRRVHMTKAQAIETIVELAKALDDGTYLSFGADCMTTDGDSVAVEPIEGGVEIDMQSERGGRPTAVHLRKECAVNFALAMLSFTGEINGD
ncbi:hypothetical protein DDSR119_50 [Pseudomonas phage DDSR119]|nr:hypothetical protein DDSR119_50 [Pseudomonas phage DDSR119]